MTVMAGIETSDFYSAEFPPLPDTGLPLPDDAPEYAECAWCRHLDRASLMFHAGALALFCTDLAGCNWRWEENRQAVLEAAAADPDGDVADPDVTADDGAEA